MATDFNSTELAERLDLTSNNLLQFTVQLREWAAGTVDGGPNGDGIYPLSVGITTYMVPCPAKMVASTQKGDTAGIQLTFSTTTTDADPGPGKIRANNASLASATALYVDNVDFYGNSLTALLDSMDDGTSASKGLLYLQDTSNAAKFALFEVTGSVVDGTGYRKLTVAYKVGGVALSDASRLALSFSRAGDKGDKGDKGWSPATVAVSDGDRRVRKLIDWIGGEGTKPAITSGGLDQYESASGFTTVIGDATDVRGAIGPPLFQAVYSTRAALYADLAHNADAFGIVYDDATLGYNGTYIKAGASGSGSWVKQDSTGGLTFQELPPESGYLFALVDAEGRAALLVTLDGSVKITKLLAQSITQAALALGAVGTPQLADGAVSAPKLDPVLQTLLAQSMDPTETGFVWAVIDLLSRYAIAIDTAGAVHIPRLILNAGSVTSASLGSDVAPYVAQYLSPESGYVWGVVDSAGRLGLGLTTDGTLVGKFSNAFTDGSVVTAKLADGAVTTVKIAASAVTEAKIDATIARLVVPHAQDVVEVFPDDHRASFAEVGVRTAADGSFWERLPRSLTANVRGVNQSGTSLSFRRTAGLSLRGKRYAGTYAPGSLASIRYRGDFTSVSAYPPAPATPVLGDYFIYKDSVAGTFGSDSFIAGDLSVYDGSAWVKQASPVPLGGGGASTRQPGDWWAASSSGTFDGVAYSTGDRVVHLGVQAGGGPIIPRWLKGDVERGEMFYRGEFDPASGLPASPSDGEVYQASLAGSAGGFTFVVGDYLVREAGVWGQAATDAIRDVASGAWISLPCAASAAEWEVRRTDKSSTRVGAQLKSRRQSAPRRGRFDLALYSDSMFGSSGTGNSIVSKLGRTGVVFSFGGATSRDILSMMEYEIAALGDRYRGAVHILWHGQNNTPGTSQDANSLMLRETSLRMAELVGARDRRFMFMSILGVRNMTWSGSRLVCSQLETAFGGSGVLVELDRWYQRAFPGQVILPRQILLAAAVGRTTPDPQFPGMTEAQVAATYGIVPYSFYGAALPVAANLLNYVGTRATTGLPTGGSANDYYIRIGGAGVGEKVGNLVINIAGVWTEWAQDTVHLSAAGGDALSTGVAAAVNANFY